MCKYTFKCWCFFLLLLFLRKVHALTFAGRFFCYLVAYLLPSSELVAVVFASLRFKIQNLSFSHGNCIICINNSFTHFAGQKDWPLKTTRETIFRRETIYSSKAMRHHVIQNNEIKKAKNYIVCVCVWFFFKARDR